MSFRKAGFFFIQVLVPKSPPQRSHPGQLAFKTAPSAYPQVLSIPLPFLFLFLIVSEQDTNRIWNTYRPLKALYYWQSPQLPPPGSKNRLPEIGLILPPITSTYGNAWHITRFLVVMEFTTGKYIKCAQPGEEMAWRGKQTSSLQGCVGNKLEGRSEESEGGTMSRDYGIDLSQS